MEACGHDRSVTTAHREKQHLHRLDKQFVKMENEWCLSDAAASRIAKGKGKGWVIAPLKPRLFVAEATLRAGKEYKLLHRARHGMIRHGCRKPAPFHR